MKIWYIPQFRTSLIKLCLYFLVSTAHTAANADSEAYQPQVNQTKAHQVYQPGDICTLTGLDCLLLAAGQNQDMLAVISNLFRESNKPSVSADLKEVCESSSPTEKDSLIADKRLQQSQRVGLDSISNLRLIALSTKPAVSGCAVESANKSAAIGVLLCALIGFVILSNKRRI